MLTGTYDSFSEDVIIVLDLDTVSCTTEIISADGSLIEVVHYFDQGPSTFTSTWLTTAVATCPKSFEFALVDSDGSTRAEGDFSATESSILSLNDVEGSFDVTTDDLSLDL